MLTNVESICLNSVLPGRNVNVTRRANFIRLAEARVNKAMKAIRIIGNLSNKGNYEYNDEDIKAIVNALQKEINDMKAKFKNEGTVSEMEFRLKR